MWRERWYIYNCSMKCKMWEKCCCETRVLESKTCAEGESIERETGGSYVMSG